MQTKLVQVQRRIDDLEVLANEVAELAKRLSEGENVQPDLAIKGQRWYRGSREILVQVNSSALREYEECYDTLKRTATRPGAPIHRQFTDIEQYIAIGTNPSWDQLHWFGDDKKPNRQNYYALFHKEFQKARSLVISVVDEILSRELPIATQLSFELVADEFTAAEAVLTQAKDQEVFQRVSGIIARVALERHLFTVADQRNITVSVNPPHKKKPEAQMLSIRCEKLT